MSSANHTQPKEMFQFGFFRVVSIEMSWSGDNAFRCHMLPTVLDKVGRESYGFTSVT